jgi:Protein of unknown function (DUF559)
VDGRTLDLRRPFTRAEALAAGVPRRALPGPDFVRVLHGIYRHARLPMTPRLLVEAVLLAHPPTAYASHLSAARVYGLPLDLAGPEHVTVRNSDDRRLRSRVVHHLADPEDQVRRYDGVSVSSPEQLFCELGEHLTLVDLVVAGDALVRWFGTTPERLIRAAAGAGARGRRVLRRAASYVRSGVDSPMESRLRMLIVLAGLPEPVVNHVVRWEDGRVRFRFDLCWPERRLVVEYDGRQHRDDLDQWDVDIARRDWMDEEGWSFVPVVARGIYRRPDETVERVRSALIRCGARIPASSEEWREFFPVRR